MHEVIVVGAGKWAHECWAPLLREFADRYTVCAVIDPEAQRAVSLARALGLSEECAYATLPEALSRHPHVVAGVVLSAPERHADCITELAGAGLHVLTEKPLATTPHDAARIAEAVHRFGTKLAVIQNYRYQNRIQTARRIAASGDLGEITHMVARFAADYRRPGSWDVGDAHTMAHPLLVEGAIHHVDMVRYLTGRNIRAVTAATANPGGSSFAGDCLGGLLLHLDDGVFALYEATLLAAGTENRWRNEYYRLECRDGSIVCDGPTVAVIRDGTTEVIDTPDPDMFTGHRALIGAFADWLDGGPAVETTVDDNLRSLAAIFAAIESAETGTTTTVAV